VTPTTWDDEQEDDKEITLLVKNMRRMYHKNQKRSVQKKVARKERQEKRNESPHLRFR